MHDRQGEKDGQVEGEGSYSGTKAYNKATEEFLKKGKVDEAAEKAKRALELRGGYRIKGGRGQGPRRRSQRYGEEA